MLITQKTLLKFLSTVRPARTAGEEAHVATIIKLAEKLGYEPYQDAHGNIVVDNLGSSSAQSRVMFTSHTDSIHRNAAHTTQKLKRDGDTITVDLAKTPESTCLGADDATGNYIMLRLLQAGVKGVYVFFRDEEIGGLGSNYFATNPMAKPLIEQLTHCISFDRLGYDSIITHQLCGRCASDMFADELGKRIKEADPTGTLDLSADPTGSFTDSANFADLISECSNISVGYFKQHTVKESQDIGFVEKLTAALEKIDWETLPAHRDPLEVDYGSLYDDGYGYVDTPSAVEALETEIDNIYRYGSSYATDLTINQPELAAALLVYLAR